MSVNTKMTAIANAIRAKTGKAAALTLDQMVTEIEGITGGSELFAVIAADYPVGATISCSKGTTELPPVGIDGQCIFAVPEAGTWTVTATSQTDPTKSSSQIVEIDTEGQIKSVTISLGLILFDSTVTSGWIKSGYSGHSAVISGGLIKLTGDPTLSSAALMNIGLYYYGTKVKCTSDMTLKVSVTSVGSSYDTYGNACKAKLVAVSDPANVDGKDIYEDSDTIDNCRYFIASANIAGTGITSLSLPEGEYYLGIAFSNYVQLSADKVWLE